MAKEWAKEFYESPMWKRTRHAYRAARYGLCERCSGVGKIVHHKEWLTPENIHDDAVTLGWDNLELLCADCHNREHMCSDAISDGLRFDAEGNVVESAGGIPPMRPPWMEGVSPLRGPAENIQAHMRGGVVFEPERRDGRKKRGG